ncbi:MAG: succinylglutamate desuccinylase/aspartoacylase family protein [Lachnospiraceae bacterium]|nr:succinylglutamate desuccinylase/aspartoacylase family protein [Lachnospiraceae bacterium]
MQIVDLYSFKSIYRDDMQVKGYVFGSGEKSACIVGPSRGNEYQQLYICSQLVKKLTELEKLGVIANDKQIMVIPCINEYAFNLSKDFFGVKNLDINTSFPGNDYGEPITRLTGGLFEKIKEYTYEIQFTSFYERAQCVPHVRMTETGYQNVSLANLFGLPYVVVKKPLPTDTATLNYNMSTETSSAFTIYTKAKEQLDEKCTNSAISAVLRFLTRMGIIKYECHSGYISHVLKDEDLTDVYTEKAGIFKGKVECGEYVQYGQKMAEIINPFDGSVLEEIVASTDGIVFFAHNSALINQYETAFRMVHRLHD